MKSMTAPAGRVRGLFTFALLCVYVLCACLMLMAGVQVFRSVSSRAAGNYDSRTVLAYISGKLRSGDEPTFENGVLTLKTAEEDGGYETYIYCADGALCEYSGVAEREFDPSLGQEIAKAAKLVASIEGGVVKVSITDGAGYERSVCHRLRAGEAMQ